MSAINLAAQSIGQEAAYAAVTWGRIQTFFSSIKRAYKNGTVPNGQFGNSAVEFAALMRASDEAQLWVYYAYVMGKEAYRTSLFKLQPQACARFFNGAGPTERFGYKWGSPYGYRLECLFRGQKSKSNNPYYKQESQPGTVSRRIVHMDDNWMVGNKTTYTGTKLNARARAMASLTPAHFVPNSVIGTHLIPDF